MRETRTLSYVRKNAFDDVYVPTWLTFVDNKKVRSSFSKRAIAAITILAYISLSSAGVALGNVGRTVAFFSDSEHSVGNVLSAGFLDFLAGDSPQNIDIIPDGNPVTIPTTVTAVQGSATTTVRVHVVITGGEPALCNALVVSTAAPFVYSGTLTALTGTSSLNTALTLSLTLPAPVPNIDEHSQCKFDLVFNGWNSYVPENTGYTDEERIAVTVTDPPLPAPSAVEPVESVVPPAPPEEPASTPDTVATPDPAPEPPPASQDVPPQDPPPQDPVQPIVVDTPAVSPDPQGIPLPPAPASE